MKPLLFIAAGGAIGACLRYAISLLLTARPGQWPLSTLLINVGGSLAIGAVYVLIVERGVMSADWRHLLMTGFLGALTTFSAFSLEAVLLLDGGRWATALAYTAASAALCIIAAASGLQLARLLVS